MVSEKNLGYREELPEGWWSLFQQLLAESDQLDPSFSVVQAKQKFGELRVYLQSYPPRALDLIDAATVASKSTCEVCGGEAVLRVTRGYYQTLCGIHGAEADVVQKSPITGRFRFGKDGLKDLSSKGEKDNG